MNVESFEHAGLLITIYQEEYVEHADPREYDNLGVMWCEHRNYVLGDPKAPEIAELQAMYEAVKERGLTLQHLERWMRWRLGTTVVLPLYLYDHSGITMSTGDFRHIDSQGWDWGMVGIIFDTERTREMLGTPADALIQDNLENEVKAYDAYLRGEVYGFEIERVETCSLGEEHKTNVGGCGGFLIIEDKDMDYMRSEAKAEAEAIAKGE